MPPSSSSVRDFLLQQELPENALLKAQNSLHTFFEQQEEEVHHEDGSGSRTCNTGCCPCPHWRKYLPQQLDLSFCEIIQSTSEKEDQAPSVAAAAPPPPRRTAWVLNDPVHALHLQSQLEQPPDSYYYSDEAPVLLFGDEQERLLALKTEGLAEAWHPWIQEPSSDVPLVMLPTVTHRAASASSDNNRAAIAPTTTARRWPRARA